MIPIAFIIQEYTRRYIILPSFIIVRSTKVPFTKRIEKFIESDVFRELTKAVKSSIKYEIFEALTTEDLTKTFQPLTEKFWLRLALPMFDINQKLFSLNAEKLSEFKKLEEDMAYEIVELLRHSGYKYSENLIFGLSTMVDYDIWLLEKISKLKFEGFVKKLWERALEEILQLSGCLRYLFFAWASATSATLKLIERYKEENRDTLAQWCKTYAEEVEIYIDTLDTLLDDETYKIIEELGIVRKQG
jgi:hypothetical protein